MNLVIDIGNTRTKVGLFDEGELVISTSLDEITSQYILLLKEKYTSLNKVIVTSGKNIVDELYATLQSNFKTVVLLDYKTPVPVNNCYLTPETLGFDRLSAIVGATTIYSSNNILVIDAGTAITYDFIDAQHNYLGGNISPGMKMRFAALHHFTDKLPLVEAGEPDFFMGNTTNEAIKSGVIQGLIFEMDGYINTLKKSYHDLKIILTGGDAIFFDKKLKNSIFVNLNLTLYGLNRILNHNAI